MLTHVTRKDCYNPAFQRGRSCELELGSGPYSRDDSEKNTASTRFTSYIARASQEAPHYLAKSDKTGHWAMHKGTALRNIAGRAG